jgi:Flp pilus assembly protein TadD
MRSGRWAHVAAILAVAAGVAWGQPGPSKLASGTAGTAAVGTPKAPGSSEVESSDIPDWVPSPPRFAVSAFENHSNVRAFDWLTAAAPFEIAEKTEGVLGLEPTGGSLYLDAAAIPAEPVTVAAFAATRNATWVITGWVERPNWELRIDLTLWKVTKGVAAVAGHAQRTGPVPTYHALLGDALGTVWANGGVTIDVARGQLLQRPLAIDLYAVNLMGRGLGHLIGALAPASPTADPAASAAAKASELKLAEHDLERSVFIDPKCYEAQRVLGELYMVLAAGGDAKLANKAAGKFAYANDLAPEDLSSLRAAAQAAAKAGKHEVARALFRTLVMRRPWDLDARYQLGAAMWQTGDVGGAERQLDQVTARQPDHLPARRVLVLIHASRSDTPKLVTELEAIATRAPADLEVKADLATAYGALGKWDRSTAALEAIALARPADLALLVRIGDGHRKLDDLDGAIAWYSRAGKLAPESSLPGFASAQALFDAGKLTEAYRAYISLQRYRDDLPSAEQALGAIALMQGKANDAAWYLRRATREAPRSIVTWRALVAAELSRKDPALALIEVERALIAWPRDGQLRYLAGIAHAMMPDHTTLAREQLTASLDASPGYAPARAALGALDAGGSVTLQFTPEIVRPWGNADALQDALDRYALTATTMATVRLAYQAQFLVLLGAAGRGPSAPVKPTAIRSCPIGRIAPAWAAAQQELRRYERLGVELEEAYRYLTRHDEVGATAGLLPNARTQLAAARRTFRTALADIGELRAEWTRGLAPELRAIGCNDKLLAAAVADPERYRVLEEDQPEKIPTTTPPRARARATFYVDNTRCPDPVDVWIDGAQIGQVAPGRRSALVADGGERTLCLLGPGAAQCGDRGTVRQVYLHDGWSVTLHCPK